MSSNRYISGFEYIVLAKDTLTFCPPDKFTPFSPISVKSFPSKLSKSYFNWHFCKTSSYLWGSYFLKNKILFLIVSFCIHGIWAAYPIVPLIWIPSQSFGFNNIRQFNIACNKEDFPLPTSPIIPNISPGLISILIFFKVTSNFTFLGKSICILHPSFIYSSPLFIKLLPLSSFSPVWITSFFVLLPLLGTKSLSNSDILFFVFLWLSLLITLFSSLLFFFFSSSSSFSSSFFFFFSSCFTPHEKFPPWILMAYSPFGS